MSSVASLNPAPVVVVVGWPDAEIIGSEAYQAQFDGAHSVFRVFPPGTPHAAALLESNADATCYGVASDTIEGVVVIEKHF